jgi:hypothetical protein
MKPRIRSAIGPGLFSSRNNPALLPVKQIEQLQAFFAGSKRRPGSEADLGVELGQGDGQELFEQLRQDSHLENRPQHSPKAARDGAVAAAMLSSTILS